MSATRQREPFTKLEKIFFAATLCGGVILVGAPVWWLSLEANPVVNIPAPPPLPKPNAFDYYVSASSAVVGTQEISYAVMDRLSRNGRPNFPTRLPDGTMLTQPFTATEKTSLLRQNATALQTLRRGFRYPYQEPPARSANTTFPHYATYRQLANLLVLEGQVRAGRGDWHGAANSYLDAIRFGTDIARGAGTTGRSIGISCQSIGQRPLWSTVRHLNAAQARAAAAKLQKIIKHSVPLSATLQEEKRTRQAALMEIFNGVDWRQSLVSIYGLENMHGGPGMQSVRMSLWSKSKRAVMRDYVRHMDESIAAARRPYVVERRQPPDATPNVSLSQMLAGLSMHTRFSDARAETDSTLLVVALALRAYRLEHGVYPAQLAALQPRFLKSMPLDPFAANVPLRYRRSGREYLLYSIGPDGKDDGGKPFINPGRPANSQSYYQADSLGDILAGAAR